MTSTTLSDCVLRFTRPYGLYTIAVLSIVLLFGCTRPAPVVRPVLLPTVPRPVLPAVTPADVQCLAPDAYRRLVEREQAYKQWGLKQEAIIQSNNAHAASGVHQP